MQPEDSEAALKAKIAAELSELGASPTLEAKIAADLTEDVRRQVYAALMLTFCISALTMRRALAAGVEAHICHARRSGDGCAPAADAGNFAWRVRALRIRSQASAQHQFPHILPFVAHRVHTCSRSQMRALAETHEKNRRHFLEDSVVDFAAGEVVMSKPYDHTQQVDSTGRAAILLRTTVHTAAWQLHTDGALCLPLPFHCLCIVSFTAFPLAFHCFSTAFHWHSTAFP